jgi:hypothetical protein
MSLLQILRTINRPWLPASSEIGFPTQLVEKGFKMEKANRPNPGSFNPD